MTEHASPPRLDIQQAGLASTQLAGQDLLQNYERLMHETNALGALNRLDWSVRFELAPDQAGQAQVWMHLAVSVVMPLTCQRCLGPVDLVV